MSRTRGAQSGVSGRVTVSVLYLVLSLAFNQGLKVLHLLVVLYPVFLKPIYSLFRKICAPCWKAGLTKELAELLLLLLLPEVTTFLPLTCITWEWARAIATKGAACGHSRGFVVHCKSKRKLN